MTSIHCIPSLVKQCTRVTDQNRSHHIWNLLDDNGCDSSHIMFYVPTVVWRQNRQTRKRSIAGIFGSVIRHTIGEWFQTHSIKRRCNEMYFRCCCFFLFIFIAIGMRCHGCFRNRRYYAIKRAMHILDWIHSQCRTFHCPISRFVLSLSLVQRPKLE